MQGFASESCKIWTRSSVYQVARLCISELQDLDEKFSLSSCKALHLRAARCGRQFHFIWDGFEVFFSRSAQTLRAMFFLSTISTLDLLHCPLALSFRISSVLLQCVCVPSVFRGLFLKPARLLAQAHKIGSSSRQDWFVKIGFFSPQDGSSSTTNFCDHFEWKTRQLRFSWRIYARTGSLHKVS